MIRTRCKRGRILHDVLILGSVGISSNHFARGRTFLYSRKFTTNSQFPSSRRLWQKKLTHFLASQQHLKERAIVASYGSQEIQQVSALREGRERFIFEMQVLNYGLQCSQRLDSWAEPFMQTAASEAGCFCSQLSRQAGRIARRDS